MNITSYLAAGIYIGLYFALFNLAGSAYVSRMNKMWADAHADVITARIYFPRFGSESLESIQAAILDMLASSQSENLRRRRVRWLPSGAGWIGADELSKWVRLHEVQRQAVWVLPDESIIPRFERAVNEVGELPAGRRAFWTQKALELSQFASKESGRPDIVARTYRGYLVELLADLYNQRDYRNSNVAGLYGKATWMVYIGLAVQGALIALGFGFLVIVGATGGLVSRIQKAVSSQDAPSAYGLSWVPLFLAPLLGGFAAVIGLLLISLLQVAGVLQLTAIQTSIDSLMNPSSTILAVAALLGLSERLLNRFSTTAENALGPQGG